MDLDLKTGGLSLEQLALRLQELEDRVSNILGNPAGARLIQGEVTAQWSVGPLFRTSTNSVPATFHLIIPAGVVQLGYCQASLFMRGTRLLYAGSTSGTHSHPGGIGIGHTHTSLEITEGGNTSQVLNMEINGVNVGNWSSFPADVDITKHLRDSTGKVIRGRHDVEIIPTSTKPVDIEFYAWFSATVRPLSTLTA